MTGVTVRLRRLLAVVATASVLAGAGGCGLPSQTDPKLAGPAQSPGSAQGGQKSPPSPADGLGTEQLVESFLQASVGANLGGDGAEDANKEALDRMREYMIPSKRGSWKPAKAGVVIVRDPAEIKLVGTGNGQDTVTLALDPLGTLNEYGMVSRWTGGPLQPAVYTTVLVGGQRRFQDVPADYVYISESGLRSWYTQQPIYYWSAGPDNPRLVPDLRYMPSTLSRAKQVAETLRWLQNGTPSPLVAPVVQKWSESFAVKDNPVLEDADVKVDLRGKATAQSKDDLNRLARQIRWSLPDHKPVKLTIETQDIAADSEGYLDDNATVEASQVDQTQRYLVVNDAVRSQTVGPGTPENPMFALGGRNQQVVSAAINRQGTRAALVCKVTVQGRTEQRLFVYAPDLSVGGGPRYADSGVSGARLSRPAYITYPVKRLMVSDGSRLLVSRTEDGKEFDAVELSAPLSTAAITAFAVAPEGSRIAFISGRVLMVAPLMFDKDINKFSIGTPVQVVATSLGDNQAVGWLTETSLVVGGKPTPRSVHPIGPNNNGPKYNLVAVTIDGAQEEPLPPISRTDAAWDVTELVVRVNRPGFPLDYPVLYEANQVAYRLYSSSSEALQATSEASPSNTGVTGTAPFIAD
ncbi:LpqB family beta-propeller domain-containing protein [Dactylosporangium sp. McL0621]|uniref:LpqB family beta-propeller domain-containing protein n=1 Tax=Dactylosporangium sp. McL0621 TaxID=3415678 RepID=UPI003CF88DBF